MNELIKLTGSVRLELRGPDGDLKLTHYAPNLVVTAGKNFLANWLAQSTQSTPFMNYIGLGTGSTAATTGDTGLETELTTRVAGTITDSTNVWQNQAVFAAGINTGAITEAGLFSASSGGTMLARQVFAVINKTANLSLTVTWQITLS